ncbi:MAG: NADPH:quinone reductase [Phycisphaerae bacterium]
MQAILIESNGGPDVLTLRDLPDPQPGPGQVRVDVRAAGVNPVDTYLRAGTPPYTRPTPFVPGFDAAGVVSAIGEGVTGWMPGQRVYTFGVATPPGAPGTSNLNGAYASQVLVEPGQLQHLPEGVSFEAGACLGVPCGTAYRALFLRGHARPGETVLVHGATGGVGLACCQFAAAAGLTVFGTGGTEAGRRLAEANGAVRCFDHHAEGYQDDIRQAAGGGVDLICEMLANVNLDADLDLLSPGGRVLVIGSRGNIEISPRKTMGQERSVIGVGLLRATPAELAETHAAVLAGLRAGYLRPVVEQTFPLAEAGKAHEAVMKSGHQGQVVLTV